MSRLAWGIAYGAAIIAVLIVILVVLLTRPAIATPIARQALGGSGTTIERAWVSYRPWPVAHLRVVEIEGRGTAASMDASINPLGVLPGVALIPHLSVSDGALLLELGPSRRSRAPGVLEEIVTADLNEVRLDVRRPGREPQVAVITSAEGDLGSGAFTLSGRGGDAVITMEGEAAALSLQDFEGRIRVEGENFAELAALLGFAAPDTPAFALEGELRRSRELWRFGPFEGAVGDSDLAGSMSIDFAGERPFVRAELVSRSLDFDDLGVTVGAPSKVEGAPNERQQEIAESYAADDRAIPNAELDLDRVHAVDALVTFDAESVRAGPAPLEALSSQIELQDSVLRFDRLVFTAPQGRLEVTGEIDARNPEDVGGTLAGALEGFELGQLASGRVVRGRLTAEFDVVFKGQRTRDAFASATGDAVFWSSDAEIRAIVEEGAGLDLGEVLALMLAESEEEPTFRPARCLVVRAVIRDGVAHVDPAVLDTADSVTRLQGSVDLRTEQIDLDATSDAKDVSWGSLLGGVGVGGTLRHPQFQAPLGGAAVQAGAAALLSGLTAGLAALPFIELGLGEDAPCGALLAQAEAFSEEEIDAPEVEEPAG